MRKMKKSKLWLMAFAISALIVTAIAVVFGFCCLLVTIFNIPPAVVLIIAVVVTLTIAIRLLLS